VDLAGAAGLADNVEVYSAGSRPATTINPKAIAAMSELGYDLTAHASKSLLVPAASLHIYYSIFAIEENCIQ